MTTVDKVHNIFMSFKGRSPRQVYVDASRDFGAKVNSGFAAALSDVVDDFYHMEVLDLANNYFGPKGCMALLKIVQCQQRLKKLDLTGCGLDDEVVAELVEVMQDHPRLRDIVLRNNPNISVFSGKGLARAAKLNVNIVNLDLTGTHIGENVAAVLLSACGRNQEAMNVYFSDDYFRMKDMFIGLDVDGSGWVNIKNMVGSVIYPLVQEKLEDRIAKMKPKKREDNCIDVTTFMELTYLNFKNRREIEEFADTARDVCYDTIVSNWSSLLKALAQDGAVCSALGRIQHRDAALTNEACAKIVEHAVQLQKSKTDEDGEPEQNPVDISSPVLQRAIKDKQPPTTGVSHSKRKQSFLASIDRKTFRMPPSMVRAVLSAYEKANPEGIVASALFGMTFETDFEFLKMKALKENFQTFAFPLDLTLLTLEETVNMFDEFYDVIRVAKPLSVETVKKIVDS